MLQPDLVLAGAAGLVLSGAAIFGDDWCRLPGACRKGPVLLLSGPVICAALPCRPPKMNTILTSLVLLSLAKLPNSV